MQGGTTLEALLKRDRGIVFIGLLGTALLAGAYIVYLAWDMQQMDMAIGMPQMQVKINRRERLNWWQKRLTLDHVSDLEGSLARVEAALRELQAGGRAGKTVSKYAEALAAFCDWCVERGYFVSETVAHLYDNG